MKLLRVLVIALAALAGSSAYADVKISDLPAGTTLAGTEAVPAVQSAATVKTTPAALATYTNSALTSATVIGKWTGTCSLTTFLRGDGACAASGTVTSVGLTVPSGFSVTGSPITGSGTLAITGTLNVSGGGTGAGTLTGLVLGNGTSAMSAYAGTSCTNQFPRSLNASGAATCATVANADLANASVTLNGSSLALGGTRTLSLASSDFVNQGTTTTLLHGNAAGNPSFAQASLTADVSGTLPFGNGGTGLASAADDTTLVSSGSAWVASALPNCGSSTQALAYSTSTNAFSCQTVSGSGGTPGGSDTQVQFNDAGAFAGDAGFTWSKTTNVMTLGEIGTNATIQALDRGTSGTGLGLTVKAGAANTSGSGGTLTLQGGTSVGTGGGAVQITGGTPGTASGGGSVLINGGPGGTTSGSGGAITIQGGFAATSGAGGDVAIVGSFGNGTDQNGGNVNLRTGVATGAGTSGEIRFQRATVTKGKFDGLGNFVHLLAIADQSYSYQTPATGFAITIADSTSTLILDPAGTLATGTITMPATPIDGQLVQASTSQIQTALTVSANSGQSIKNPPTSLVAGGGFQYIYRLTNTTWYRLR